ncbi:CDP-glycerol glycerophosphotransferase family protein [Mesobacillus zeae]|uniref:CDP-glycerol glycerophosphotransferase family protein n=1 Tax=Mesobacillus zeae TaxID=1917180 RepID=A0A398AX26_9BACI|nr:CDP-glycerol glycerophosphotransferase family protein [Mesobacillus zeae]RID82145.1 CDP-glycerol glycerophosphotransferase family protein [Mesobacillus zeae]
MAREIAVFLYLRVFSTIFFFSRFFPVQKKVVFVVSFIENNKYVYKELRRQDKSCRTVFLANKRVLPYFSKYEEASTLLFEISHITSFIRSVYHLATAKVVFIDNYYGFLAAANFKKEVQCIQLWHANGAIKKFGLEDESIVFRSSGAKRRFCKVYERFDKVVVGSEKMANIFKKAFNVSEDKILRTGIPRTDLFFNEKRRKKSIRKLYRLYPFLAGKRVILYAPTYRDDQLSSYELRVNLDLMKRELGSDYIFLLKLHPAIKREAFIASGLEDFAYDFSGYPNINDLLFITDILITDYSSLPFEFSLLKKPMVFFPYDLKDYNQKRGLWEDYTDLVPGPIAFSTEQIADTIKNGRFSEEVVEQFNQNWNSYSRGNSSKNVITYIKDHLD